MASTHFAPYFLLSNITIKFLNNCVKFVQSIFPHDCVLCGVGSGATPLCPRCQASLPYHSLPHCPICAIPSTRGATCGACLKQAPAYARTIAAFSYAFPIDALLQSLKYGGNLALTGILAEPLSHLAAAQAKPDMIIAMPLHPARLRARGFNQALEIAKVIGKQLAIPVHADVCQRTRDTPPQVSLPWKERDKNIKGAFACETNLNGKKIALVDDVMTTGATLNELSKLLVKQGAAEISAWVVARTLPN